MTAYELVDEVRKRPDHYLRGDRSLRQLHAIMVGYELGATRGIFSDFRPFNRWLSRKFGLPEASGWFNMVNSQADMDEKAYDLFFELLDQFRSGTK